jgi:hypothetical protein
MTKEEILLKETSGIFDEYEGGVTGIFNAMDEYAKQQVLEFGDWVLEEMWHPQQNMHTPTTWRHFNHETGEDREISTEQLYELFLKSKQP